MVLWEQVEAAELDEMWSFAGNRGCQRWLWLAIDRKTRAMLCLRLRAEKGQGLHGAQGAA